MFIAIEYNREHFNQLSEMFDVLYPECTITEAAIPTFIAVWQTASTQKVVLHWFEFCRRYIMPKLDDLYRELVLDPVDPYSKKNLYGHGSIKSYPENWQYLWRDRPFEQYNSILNGMYPKKHPIWWLHTEFQRLQSLKQ